MFKLTQMHIEAARNSTDDFNLFHDKLRWDMMPDNPFGGPIALGFQLGCFIETQINQIRAENAEAAEAEKFNFSGFEFTFAGVVKPQDEIALILKPGRLTEGQSGRIFSNRLLLMAEGKPVIMGYKREFESCPDLFPIEFPGFDIVQHCQDRSFLNDKSFFIKHKYMIVGNAKNFLNSAFAEQSVYIDEFEDKVNFPQMYPLGLISSALLERAQADNHDLRRAPMIYVSHKLVIDKAQLDQLRSNHKITIVVSPQYTIEGNQKRQKLQYCLAYNQSHKPLFKAVVELMPLSELSN